MEISDLKYTACNMISEMNDKRHLKGVKATLNYRRGYCYLIEPPPTLDYAVLISTDIKKSFDKWQNDYKKAIASACSVDLNDLHIRQNIRIRPEGNTRVVDWPLVIYENELKSFNTRLCVGVCTGSTSTKTWARASLPVNIDGTVTPITTDCLEDRYKFYKDIASHSLDWLNPKIPYIVNKHLNDSIVQCGRRIDIVVIGVNDEDLAEPFIDLSEHSLTISDILANNDLDNKLSFYYRNICGIDVTLSDYVDKNNPVTESSLLFNLYLSVTTSSGYMEQRTVLFLLREKEEYTEIVGLAYDDSVEMDIPLRAGPILVKTIGHWF